MDETMAVIGGGPSGLMAAEVLSAAGRSVTVYERMPSLGRKFLMAGRGGLNLTHSEDLRPFLGRYGAAGKTLKPLLEAFTPADLIAWAQGLDQPTFVGSSGRVFPKSLKASPLLRAWLARLDAQGVTFRTRMTWTGWDDHGALTFENGEIARPAATVLALGGASWAKLGSDGAWASVLAGQGVALAAFEPANGGFLVDWSPVFRERFAGQPLKAIAITHGRRTVRGEAVVAGYGIEGGAIYALSSDLRAAVAAEGSTTVEIDLRPDLSAAQLTARLDRPRSGQSAATFLRKAANLSPLEINLLREAHGVALPADLAAAIKRAPLKLTGLQGLARAISTAGGVRLNAVDEHLMLKARANVYVAGEMLDWEAPTGGYLLQACFATGVAAARAVLAKV
ncbi:TIGR03862 family flavoprotein [Phenylobacterium sp. 20VBR1]|uniref:TIGR03862 family flavoprotein n=1 Tax=Phenylobacterium glaciei TaxID=2803784 RepID=A0A941D2P5_9CAUL|nr:TIGR03862 family flavoprotein [Phenylobacterium glaciei]MBR7620279.1 TIGR03862 family flavoprotein [Phenylobacterium glaciei]